MTSATFQDVFNTYCEDIRNSNAASSDFVYRMSNTVLIRILIYRWSFDYRIHSYDSNQVHTNCDVEYVTEEIVILIVFLNPNLFATLDLIYQNMETMHYLPFLFFSLVSKKNMYTDLPTKERNCERQSSWLTDYFFCCSMLVSMLKLKYVNGNDLVTHQCG